MSLNIGAALETGVERSVTSVALTFVVIVLVLQTVNSIVASTYVDRYFPRGNLPSGTNPQSLVNSPVLPYGLVVVAVVSVVFAILTIFVTIAMFRAFVADIDHVTLDLFTRRGLGAFAHFFALGVVFFLIALLNVIPILGTIVFVFLMVSLWFAPLRIAAADDGFVSAMRTSWALTKGNRLRLFVLAFVFLVVLGVVDFVLVTFLRHVPGGFIVNSIVSAYLLVLNVTLTVAAYDQLVDERDAAGEPATQGGGDDGDDDRNRTPEPTAVGH